MYSTYPKQGTVQYGSILSRLLPSQSSNAWPPARLVRAHQWPCFRPQLFPLPAQTINFSFACNSHHRGATSSKEIIIPRADHPPHHLISTAYLTETHVDRSGVDRLCILLRTSGHTLPFYSTRNAFPYNSSPRILFLSHNTVKPSVLRHLTASQYEFASTCLGD